MRRGDQKCPCGCHWNWGWLEEAFGENLTSVGDLDHLFYIERMGLVFFIETKRENEELSLGQKKAFEALSKLLGARAFLVRGPRSNPKSYQECKNGVWQKVIPTDRERFTKLVGAWFRWAS